MSFKAFLTALTKDTKTISAQIVLRNGMSIVCPRRVSLEDDAEFGAVGLEAAYDDFKHEEPALFVGMLIMPAPGGQQHLVKSVFDPNEVVTLVFVPEEALPKVGNDRAPVPRGGRTPSGLVIP